MDEAPGDSLPAGAPLDGLAAAAPALVLEAPPDVLTTLPSTAGLDPTQTAVVVDGGAGEESFAGQPLGAGIQENAAGGADTEAEPAAGWRSVDDGGRRAGSLSTYSSPALREFRLAGQGDAAGYGSALYGHAIGGVITSLSRSGGSRLHGMALYTVRSSVWAASSPFDVASSYANGLATSGVVKPHDLRQQFAARVGGPVAARGKDPHLFYLYAFDLSHRAFPAVSSPAYAGFYNLSATQTALLANRGVTSGQIGVALTYLSGLTGSVARSADQTLHFGRLDWQPARRNDRLAGEYTRSRWSNPAGARSAAVVARAVDSIGSSFGAVDLGLLRWTRLVTPRLSTEVRAQYSRELQYETPQTPLAQEPAVGPGGFPPEVSIGPEGIVYGTPAGLGQHAYPEERRAEVSALAVWARGRHLFTVGGDLSLLHDHIDSLANTEGTFTYDSGTTGGHAGGLVDWISDFTYGVNAYPNGACPSITAPTHDFCFRSYSQSFGTQAVSFDTQEWAGFVQDDWRAGERLSVHAGLRYEYQLLPLPQYPNLALDTVFGATAASSVFPEDRNNLGPRLGLEWRPLARSLTVVRAGYGVYYGLLPGATIREALLSTGMASSTTRIRITPTTETVCPQRPTVAFGFPCSYLTAPSGVVAATTSTVVFDRRFRLPMNQQGTLSLERPVGLGVVMRASYLLNVDRQLATSVDLNIAPAAERRTFELQGGDGLPGVRDGETFAVPVYSARVSTAFGPVTDVRSSANAIYHGMTVEARRGLAGMRAPAGTLGRELEFRLAYTWSKAIDYGPTAGATPRTSSQFDPFANGYDKGLSALNLPHRVAGTLAWGMPIVQAGSARLVSRVAAATASSWTIAAIATASSGRPYSYEIFGGTRLTGGHETINASGGSTVLPTVGRNTLQLPDTANLDLRVSRTFALREHIRVNAAVQAYNVLNHVNVAGVQQRAFLVGPAVNGMTPLVYQDAAAIAAEGLNTQPFGTYTSSSAGSSRQREIEFSLRLEF
jgi:hypothetical protein